MASIVFTDTIGVLDVYAPKPAFQVIPDWYKDTESYLSDVKKPNGNGDTSATIKRCMPIFDALNSGYILVTYNDIWVSKKSEIDAKTNEPTGKKVSWYEWPSFSPIQFHSIEQAKKYPNVKNDAIPKWTNPWGIKTPPGFSTLFIPPVHRNNVFTAFPGVVDTDTYTAPVNIVFVLSDPDFEGLVPAGTPIVQVIPFKRESWEMSLGNERDFNEQVKVTSKLRTKFFDSYKTQYRQVKEYR
jgi:hypothetical protein